MTYKHVRNGTWLHAFVEGSNVQSSKLHSVLANNVFRPYKLASNTFNAATEEPISPNREWCSTGFLALSSLELSLELKYWLDFLRAGRKCVQSSARNGFRLRRVHGNKINKQHEQQFRGPDLDGEARFGYGHRTWHWMPQSRIYWLTFMAMSI